MNYKFDITLGLLTHNSPVTLDNTLNSYQQTGFLSIFDDIICIVQPSQKQELEIDICQKYKIKYEVQADNTKMAGGIRRIWELAEYDKMMFLECDFVICENKDKINSILEYSIQSLNSKEIDVVRLRSLKNPGHPIQHNLFMNHHRDPNWKDNIDLLRQSNYITNYSDNPESDFPELIKKISIDPTCYLMSSRHCVYTNNPYIVTRSFYTDEIKPYIRDGSILEDIIDLHWHLKDYKILITSGIFKHNRLDGHINCDCCPVEFGGRGRCSFGCCSNGKVSGVKYFESTDIKI